MIICCRIQRKTGKNASVLDALVIITAVMERFCIVPGVKAVVILMQGDVFAISALSITKINLKDYISATKKKLGKAER